MSLLLILAGDVEANPGHTYAKCGICTKRVLKRNKAIQFDECDLWIHAKCDSGDKWYCSNCNFDCGLCDDHVKLCDASINCNSCDKSFHTKCCNFDQKLLLKIRNSSCMCPACKVFNFSD